MNNILCPYPGLRHFEEDEAIFFKGREQHIKGIFNQLQKKNFVMLTGASGDGKSSVVYAGMIPHIKSGFAKGRYNQWEFAIIKPEGKPLQNLNRELSNIFKLDSRKLFDELSLGFSSLVDIYCNSELHINEDSSVWHNLDIKGKREARSKGRNLFILVDQFEELFTNSENFLEGEPCEEAEIFVNLLLETVHLAQARQLPIYVVFTMRSDFIGNCTVFRGLPELIGNSHFFIPRLNREEIEKAIVEPALLNDDTITPQLANQLVSAASDSIDQLPIVQFALSRVWQLGKEFNEPMDLIHLAMAGGLDPLELAETERKRFLHYRNMLPDEIRPLFDNASLRNVLNLRANQLMLEASESFLATNKGISPEEVLQAFRLCFHGLTKTDGGRMVRYRSSLRQLTLLVDNPKFSDQEIAALLHPFREEGNCLIYPSTRQLPVLQSDDFLDISHEALIRNWQLLRTWTQENTRSIADYNDLRTQLNRWKESGEKQNFLLAIGPLQQFETWLKENHISGHWIAKKESSTGSLEVDHTAAEAALRDLKEYLRASREYLDMKTRRKKKRARFIMSMGTLAILILSILSVWAVQQKNLANEQTILADEKRVEAEKSRAAAAQSAEVAFTKEQEALLAKSDAERAAALANEQRSIAEAKTIFANQQQLIAQSEANRANQEAEKAKEQKNMADDARQNAERSEKTSRALTNRAFTQVLAFMAHQTLYNPLWSVKFAHHALQRHLEQGDSKMDPVIFNACFESAIKAFGKDSAFNVKGDLKLWNSGAQLSIPNFNAYLKPLPANCIFQSSIGPTILTQNGYLISLSEDSLKYAYLDIIGDGISFASFDEQTGILFHQGEFPFLDKKIDKNCKYLPVAAYDSKNYNKLVNAWPCIPGLGILKGAKYFPASGKYLLLSKSGTSFVSSRILHLRGTAEYTWETEKINDEIIATTTLPNGILAATQSGKLIFINENNEFTEITTGQKKSLPCFALAPSIGSSFYAGYSDGSIDYFNFSEGKWTTRKIHLARGVMVRKLAYNSTIGTLAALFSDNTIAIVKENQKPFYIEMEAVRAIGITNNNYLITNLADASTKVIPLNLEVLNHILCGTLDDFTPTQWSEIFGDEYPFIPINCSDEN
jgi:hypothetical protein